MHMLKDDIILVVMTLRYCHWLKAYGLISFLAVVLSKRNLVSVPLCYTVLVRPLYIALP